ncbi:MAG: hypothetical protein ACPGU1_13420 [Myxococcota bacterium]
MNRSYNRLIHGALSVGLTAFVLTGVAYAETFQRVVPPGQERQLGVMVGVGKVVFPGGCKLDSATVVKSVIRVTYRCGAKGTPVELMLHPPEHTGDILATTGKFVLTRTPGDKGPLPEGFITALAERIRANEARWYWMKVKGDHQAAKSHLLPTPPKTSEAPAQALDPRHVKMFEAGAALYREQKHAEALVLFLELARENNRFGGVLGMVVANLAPTKPNSAKVAEYVAAAEAAPDDLLSQYVAGVAAHYSAHYIASTHEEKRRLYTTSIRFLDKTRPTLEFEPRVFIYLAVSHYRLGNQAEAEPLIEKAVTIAKYDPDAYYCRAEIFHRTDVARSLDDLETYLIMTRKFAEAGGWAADEKIQRVQAMRDYLKRVQAGEAVLAEIFDPLASDTPGTVAPHIPAPAEPSKTAQALAKPQAFSRWVGLVGLFAALILGLGVWLQRRKAGAPTDV